MICERLMRLVNLFIGQCVCGMSIRCAERETLLAFWKIGTLVDIKELHVMKQWMFKGCDGFDDLGIIEVSIHHDGEGSICPNHVRHPDICPATTSIRPLC